MQNKIWSEYIQTPEELDLTRNKVFAAKNDAFWKSTLSSREDPIKILEIGCGGGLLSRKLSEFYPQAKVYGIDLDQGHIEYARNVAKQNNISNCFYLVADAHHLPFEDNTFDICISHTVMNFCEPNRFLQEQYRVLKNQGLIVVCLAKERRCINPTVWMPEEGREKELLDKLIQTADSDKEIKIISYHTSEQECLEYLYQNGFSNIKMEFLPNIVYFPDQDGLLTQDAINEINANRKIEQLLIEKSLRRVPTALSKLEIEELYQLLNNRFDNRIVQLEAGNKMWDMTVSFTFVASALCMKHD